MAEKEEVKKIVTGMMAELWHSNDDSAVARYFHPDLAQAVLDHKRELLNGFPDLSIEIEELIGEDNKVVARLFLSGTHKGDFAGGDPTGKRVRWSSVRVYSIRDGLICDAWGIQDRLSLMQQIGVVPENAGDAQWATSLSVDD